MGRVAQATALLLVVLLAACASRLGVAEFRVYTTAFDEVVTASEPILSRMRVSERDFQRGQIASGESVHNRVVASAPSGIVTTLFPEHAIYFVEGVDPPVTAVVRSSLETVASYNRVLLLYAEGRALDSLKTELDRLGTEASLALKVIDSGFAADLAGAFSGAAPALAAIREAAALVLRAGSRQAFRNELVARNADVHALIDALIQSSTPIYRLIALKDIRKLRRGEDAEARQRLEAMQGMVAEWVVALQTSKVALDRAVAAAAAQPGAAGLLAGAADVAAEIRGSAERIRDLSAKAGGA